MSTPTPGAPVDASRPSIARGAIWIAIAALIAAAIVSVVWVLVGTQNQIVGRAFLTILLLAAFAGVALFDTHVAPRRPAWYTLASMVAWVIALIAGALKIWMPDTGRFWDAGFTRFLELVGIVLVLRLALLHIRLYLRAHARYTTTFTRAIVVVTVVLVLALTTMLVLPLLFTDLFRYEGLYWRFVVALTILAAVGTALVPLINALNAPRRPATPAHGVVGYSPPAPQWPTYVDGVTPLPVMPDGAPDWNAYYTGHPTALPPPPPPAAPTTDYPSPPPLPPRP